MSKAAEQAPAGALARINNIIVSVGLPNSASIFIKNSRESRDRKGDLAPLVEGSYSTCGQTKDQLTAGHYLMGLARRLLPTLIGHSGCQEGEGNCAAKISIRIQPAKN